ncbi:hypothetical protein SKAU_G00090130 [Synaphobranchus kaupii]|uniref:Uncharacterized protein n=1 Tax=Synaphobranchus kaupii TaxID=118154 RepID=A0A9Q1J482_SYNKA|nr:hypothetical protein SKAU_G00090130 [Synaphobranchus kaupii]
MSLGHLQSWPLDSCILEREWTEPWNQAWVSPSGPGPAEFTTRFGPRWRVFRRGWLAEVQSLSPAACHAGPGHAHLEERVLKSRRRAIPSALSSLHLYF